MLLQIRDYILQHGRVSSQQLCRHFSMEFSALEPILARWEQAGTIKSRQTQNPCAKKCSACSPNPIIYYEKTPKTYLL